MLRSGYILTRRSDLVWFLALPIVAVAIALLCHQWLPGIAVASVGLWITIPHHFATWFRIYGLSEDWKRWKGRLILGPIVIAIVSLVAIKWFPLTLLALTVLWDHQHSLMQQHGIGRIYDFKARTGTTTTGKFDLMLHCFLYVNLFLTAPLFVNVWLRELHRWHLPISAASVVTIQQISCAALASYLVVYVGHIIWSLRKGHAVNPIKFLFFAASYFLWYFTSWHSDSFLVFGIAHRMMHGIQYIVIVHSYVRRKSSDPGQQIGWFPRLAWKGNEKWFLVAGLFYAALYQIIVAAPLDQFGFGVVNFMAIYEAVPELGIAGMSEGMSYDLFAATIISAAPLTHYYFDSFIWKVRQPQTQEGL